MSKLLINEPPLQVLPTLALWVGLNEAVFLQQLHYWLTNPKVGRKFKDRKWVRNTINEWQAENFPFWGKNTIRRAIENLETDGLILSTSEMNHLNYDKTKWYTIDYKTLDVLSGPVPRRVKPITQNGQRGPLPKMGKESTQNGQSDLPKMGKPIPETTTETTSIEKTTTTTKAELAEFKILFEKHFGKLPCDKDDPLRLDVMATIKKYGLAKVKEAIHIATVERANGQPRTWGYVKGILENSNEPKKNGASTNGRNGTSQRQNNRLTEAQKRLYGA